MFGSWADSAFSMVISTDELFAAADGILEDEGLNETRRFRFGENGDEPDNDTVGDDGRFVLGVGKDKPLGEQAEDWRRCSMGDEKEDALDIEVAGDDGIEAFDMEQEEVRDIGLLGSGRGV